MPIQIYLSVKKIILISDTHSLLREDVVKYFDDCDEIWHAGDIGSVEVLDELRQHKPLRVVYGNIDEREIRDDTVLNEIFTIEGLKVLITHIGGYPGRYSKRLGKLLREEMPGLYICGHSHILKVMMDKELGILHMNPGACGIIGMHKFRTMLKFEVANGKVQNLNAIELGLRSALT